MPEDQNFSALSESEEAAVFSKWSAANAFKTSVSQRLRFYPPGGSSRFGSGSDLEESLFLVIDFLKSVDAPETTQWEERFRKNQALESRGSGDFLNGLYSRYHGRSSRLTTENKGPDGLSPG